MIYAFCFIFCFIHFDKNLFEEIVELEKQKDSLHEAINSAALDLNSKKIDLGKIKDILHDCASDLLKHNHLTEDSLKCRKYS